MTEFTYKYYGDLLENAKHKGYSFCGFNNTDDSQKAIILRHDIDFSIDKALNMAVFERSLEVSSTYFVLLTSGFYNIFVSDNLDKLKEICKLGHKIGLHFDEKNYKKDIGNPETVQKHILKELDVISDLFQERVNIVSYHRPSREIIDANLELPGIINSYSNQFFKQFKYVSDSRRCWREPVEDIINCDEYKHVQILTHPFWYDDTERSIAESLGAFIEYASSERYRYLEDNFSRLNDVLSIDDGMLVAHGKESK